VGVTLCAEAGSGVVAFIGFYYLGEAFVQFCGERLDLRGAALAAECEGGFVVHDSGD
jgi:hypothetical protein